MVVIQIESDRYFRCVSYYSVNSMGDLKSPMVNPYPPPPHTQPNLFCFFIFVCMFYAAKILPFELCAKIFWCNACLDQSWANLYFIILLLFSSILGTPFFSWKLRDQFQGLIDINYLALSLSSGNDGFIECKMANLIAQ